MAATWMSADSAATPKTDEAPIALDQHGQAISAI